MDCSRKSLLKERICALGRVGLWPGWLRFAVFTALGAILWKFPATVIRDAIVWLAFLGALIKGWGGLRVWFNAAGAAFAALALFVMVSIPFSTRPALSLSDFVGSLDILAAVFAITVLFDSEDKVERALFYGAFSVIVLVGFDLCRLAWRLRGDLLTGAHKYQPFWLTHTITSSLAAGIAAIIMVYFCWKWRREAVRCAGCAGAILVALAYIVVTASRGPQLALAAAVGTAGLCLLPGWRKKAIWALLLIAAGTIAVANIDRINRRYIGQTRETMLTGRETVWAQTWKLAQKRPIFGYGYGKKSFQKTYGRSKPPLSPFRFNHPHHLWLFVLFSLGWSGVALFAAAWSLLGLRLVRRLFALKTFSERLLPGVVATALLCIHVYSLADWPSSIIGEMLVWLVPIALVLTKAPAVEPPPAPKTAPG